MESNGDGYMKYIRIQMSEANLERVMHGKEKVKEILWYLYQNVSVDDIIEIDEIPDDPEGMFYLYIADNLIQKGWGRRDREIYLKNLLLEAFSAKVTEKYGKEETELTEEKAEELEEEEELELDEDETDDDDDSMSKVLPKDVKAVRVGGGEGPKEIKSIKEFEDELKKAFPPEDIVEIVVKRKDGTSESYKGEGLGDILSSADLTDLVIEALRELLKRR